MELFRLLGTIAIDNTEANRALNETAQNARNSSGETSKAFEGIGKAAKGIATGVGIVGAAVGGAFIATIESTREYRKEMGLLESAFLTAGHSSETAKKTYSDLNAVMGDSGAAVEASQHLAKITDSEKELQTWTDICTGVYSEFGNAIPIESLTESALETQKNGVLTGGLVDALVWAGINEEEFQAKLDACTTEQERQDLIMNTLNDTYKDASNQYKETNKDIIEAEKANEALSDAFAELGKVGEPILTAIKNKVAEMVAVAAPKLQEFIDKIKDGIKWVKENEKTIDTWVAVIIGATTSVGLFLLILNWGKIMTAASKAITAVTTAVKLFNAALKANPIGLVISLIAGLVAAFIYLWNNNEDFRKFWLDMWDKIKTKCGDAVDWIKTKFGKFKEMLSTVKQVFGGIKDTITEKIEAAKTTVDKAIKKIKGFFDFELKFKAIKMPKISVSWESGKGILAKAAELLDLPGIPKFSVKWNALGGILAKPSIFGFDTKSNSFMGGGEAGIEALVPLERNTWWIDLIADSLLERIQSDTNDNASMQRLDTIIILLERLMNMGIYLDSGALVGELSPSINAKLGEQYKHNERGNTR